MRYLDWKEGGTLVSSLDRQGLVGLRKITAQNVITIIKVCHNVQLQLMNDKYNALILVHLMSFIHRES